MKRLLIIIPLLLAAGCNQSTNEQSSTTTASLTNQQSCAQSAAAYFKNNSVINTNLPGNGEYFSYTNHYNTELNKCFILIHDSNPGMSLFSDSYYLVDIFENKEIAYTSNPQPSYNQPKPGCNSNFEGSVGYNYTQCADLPSFNEFIKPYINN